MKRKLAALLALLMLIPTVAACSGGDDDSGKQNDTTQSTEVTDNAETTEVTTEAPKSAVPEDLDLEGFEVRILRASEPVVKSDDQLASGDVVDSAILELRNAVEENLNVTLNLYTDVENNLKNLIKSSVLSGVDDYNFIFGEQYVVAKYVVEGYYRNLLDLEYANYDAAWWATDWMDEASVGNTARYMATGDISLSKLHEQSCIYYNKSVYNNYFGDPNEMYNTVINGEWVFDEFAEISKQVYSDLNGNSEKDIDDAFAMILHPVNLTDHLSYDCGFRATQRDENGIPYLDIVNDRNVAFVEKLYNLFYNNAGTIVVTPDEAYNANEVVVPQKFAANELLFALGWFRTSAYLRDMATDYGIIPFPKYDETVDGYKSLCHDAANVVSVPITVNDENADKISAVMEEMAYLAYRDVTPAFYEVALKVKYIRDSDDLSMQILDMIHDSATTDFAYIYNGSVEGMGLCMRILMEEQNSDLASYYAAQQSAVETKFAQLLDYLTSIQ